MELRLGKKVISRDGQHVGHADGFVLDYNTRDIESIIVRSGLLLEHDRLISRELIDHVSADGTISLNVSLAQIRKQPEFVEREFVVARPHDLAEMPDEWVGSGTGAPPLYFGTGFDTLGYGREESFYGAAPVIPPETQVQTNLKVEDIIIDSDTRVITSDGETVGRVGEIEYGPDGSIIEFVVRAGILLHHDVTVPIEWVKSVGEDHVVLNVDASEVHQPHPA